MVSYRCFAQSPLITGSGIDWTIAPNGQTCATATFTVSSATLKATYLACSNTSITNTTDGSFLTNWFDLTSANTLNFNAAALVNFVPPIYLATLGPSGHPCVDLSYPSGSTAVKMLRSLNDFSQAQPVTFVFATSITNVPPSNQSITSRQALLDSDTSGRELVSVGVPTGSSGVWFAGSSVTPPTLNDTNWMVHTVVFDGASSVWFTNGPGHSRAIYTSGNPGSGGLGRLYFGTDNTRNSASWSRWYAILIYSGHMFTNDMITVETTLQNIGGF